MNNPNDQDQRVATAADWDLQPMPDLHVVLELDFRLNARQSDAVRRGYIPDDMGEHWFWYFADNVLYQHRSWTGFCIDQVYFVPDGDGLRATHAKVNRNPEEYKKADDEEDVQRIEELVMYLVSLNS